jgi:hypothetical protein
MDHLRNSELFVGVVAGLGTALIVFLSKFVWTEKLRPSLESIVYKDAKITGRWKAKGKFDFMEEVVEEEFVWKLDQKAHRVQGTIECTSGPDEHRTYDINGSFRNLVLTAAYSAQDTAALDRGTVSLMLVNNGKTLQGFCSYYSYLDHKVRSCEYTCERQTGQLPNKSLSSSG